MWHTLLRRRPGNHPRPSPPARSHPSLRTIGVVAAGVAGLGGFLVALAKLTAPIRSLRIKRTRVEQVPVTVMALRRDHHQNQETPGPAVIIVHGFAGSQQVMSPFAVTLARNGYTAITVDLPGHGQSAVPLCGELADFEGRYRQLEELLRPVVHFARKQGNGQVALLGHSMGSGIVTRYAKEHPEIDAVVGVSLVYNGGTAVGPRNLLVINGEFEGRLRQMAQMVIDQAADGSGVVGVTYGNMAAGTARRVVYAPGVEHIGVLFSRTTLAETLAWLDLCFSRPSQEHPYLDERIRWLGVLYASAVVLFVPFAELFRVRHSRLPPSPRPSLPQEGAMALPWQWWGLLTVGPAALTPFLLRLFPTKAINRMVPIMVGGPATVFFTLYGALTASGLWLMHRTASVPRSRLVLPPLNQTIAGALLMVSYVFLTFGLPTHRFLFNYFPPPRRFPIVATVFAAMLPYFLADELLTRNPAAPRGAYTLTKVGCLGSMALAIAINRNQLFFLIIVAPILALYFALYGTFSGLVYRRSGTPVIGAVANAVIFALSIASTFPLMDGACDITKYRGEG
jgi:pimeloyl-ACP methyl ester carboxylesterase